MNRRTTETIEFELERSILQITLVELLAQPGDLRAGLLQCSPVDCLGLLLAGSLDCLVDVGVAFQAGAEIVTAYARFDCDGTYKDNLVASHHSCSDGWMSWLSSHQTLQCIQCAAFNAVQEAVHSAVSNCDRVDAFSDPGSPPDS